MALVSCLDCSASVSDQSPTCIKCGRPMPRPKSDAKFDQLVDKKLRGGGRMESRTADTAVIVYGKPTSHLLHLVLSLASCGIWVPVWFLIATFGGEKRKVFKK